MYKSLLEIRQSYRRKVMQAKYCLEDNNVELFDKENNMNNYCENKAIKDKEYSDRLSYLSSLSNPYSNISAQSRSFTLGEIDGYLSQMIY